jgi:alcohol dehydrogenase class IV
MLLGSMLAGMAFANAPVAAVRSGGLTAARTAMCHRGAELS